MGTMVTLFLEEVPSFLALIYRNSWNDVIVLLRSYWSRTQQECLKTRFSKLYSYRHVRTYIYPYPELRLEGRHAWLLRGVSWHLVYDGSHLDITRFRRRLLMSCPPFLQRVPITPNERIYVCWRSIPFIRPLHLPGFLFLFRKLKRRYAIVSLNYCRLYSAVQTFCYLQKLNKGR